MDAATSKWKRALYMAPFVLISLLALFHHEPSRDEVHEFLAVIDAQSIWDIYYYLRHYTPAGSLLFVFTVPLACITKGFIGLAIFSWFITFGSVVLICASSRFRPYEKILISLGYFFLYDYCIYAGRPYGLTVFLVFAMLSLYPLRYKRPRLVAMLAALPALASVPGLILSILMLGLLGLDFLRSKRNLGNLLVGVPIIMIGLFFIMPPLGSQEKVSFMTPNLPDATHIYYIVKGILNRIFLPVTNADMYYFPHVAVDRPQYSLLLALIFLTLTFVVAPRRLLPMVFFWTVSAVFMGLLIVHPGGIRHQGFLMIILLASVWLDRLYEQEKPLFTVRYLHHPIIITMAFIAILTLQVWSGLNAVYIDYKYPNSLGKEAARFLREDMASTPPERTLIATFYSGLTTPIVMFLPQSVKFYSIELERNFRYIPTSIEWGAVDPIGHSAMYNLQMIMERFMKEVQSGKYDRFYIVLPFPIEVRFNNAVLRLVYMPSTRKVITGDEIYFIYRLDRQKKE